ncbi:MMPL family transporter [Paenibacillus filicis]|uniref:MMPL family transporter n=1 Tax=Paenibacillus gyeongsangnamensis TaxID=3388067 RepID=A0ABT4Q4Y0_9BACL|nr:MMPL family transporter [Paenibacillus filicis]MCZ8511891.1 MMPL family transporter [Paenibacillus filicis]
MVFHHIAILSFRWPRTVLAVWTLVLITTGFFAVRLPSVLQNHGLLADGAFVRVEKILASDYGIPADPVILVFEQVPGGSPEQLRRFVGRTLSAIQGLEGLTGVKSPLDSEEMLSEHAAYALLAFRQKPYGIEPVLIELKRRLPEEPGMTVRMTGKSVVQADVNRLSRQDLQQAEKIGLPAAFIILLLAFGGFVSAMLPLLAGIFSVTAAMGFMYWLGTHIALSNFVLNVIPMVGLALSIDFALLLVSRFREELSAGSAEDALSVTMQTAFRAVGYSAASVFLGLTAVLFIRLPMFTTVAYGALSVLTTSVLVSLTLLPALLAIFRPAIMRESVRAPGKEGSPVWAAWSGFVMKRPVLLGTMAVLLLLGCLLPLGGMRLAIPDATSLPRGTESRLAAEAYTVRFAGTGTTKVFFLAQGKGAALKADEWRFASRLTRQLTLDPAVLRVESVFANLPLSAEQIYAQLQRPHEAWPVEQAIEPWVKRNRILIQVTIRGEPGSQETMDWVRRWEWEGVTYPLRFQIGGEAKYQQEVFDEIFRRIPYVLMFLAASNYAVLFLAFRSVLLPVKAIVMNLLSLAASFGILTWLFRSGSFGLEPYPIAVMIPVFIFGLVFGISMDYGVFLLSRIYEAYLRTGDNRKAVMLGMSASSRIITSAAAILIAVTVPFAFAGVVGVKQLGIGIAAAIVIDATIIRLVLVPSLMKLLGRWNWWAPCVLIAAASVAALHALT